MFKLKGKYWRRITKTLDLVENIIKSGSEECINELREKLVSILQLINYNHSNDGLQYDNSIPEKAGHIVDLLTNEEKF